MSDPVTWGYVALAAGTGVSAYSASEQAGATADAAKYTAQVARNNQTIADMYARQETEKGIAEEQQKQETAQREGTIRAAVGGSGLDPNVGSPLRLQESTASLGALDAATIRASAARAAYGYTVQGLSFQGEAGLEEAKARQASEAGALGAFSSIIGGASSVSDKWAKYKTKGVDAYT